MGNRAGRFVVFFLSIISFNFSAFAEHEDRDWFAAGEWDVEKAPCLNPLPPKPEVIWERILQKFDVDDLETAFADLNPKIRWRARGNDRTKESYARLLKSAFEKESAYLVWLRLEFGFNALEFRQDELESLYSGFSAFPKGFRAPKENYKLSRVRQISQGVLANATLTFSGIWGGSPHPKRVYTVVHELGHKMDLDTSDSEEWRSISGFPQIISTKATLRSGSFVSVYAEKNQWEDFAESVSAYRLNPHRLMGASSDKYQVIRWQVFGGLEFYEKNECQRDSVLTPATEISSDEADQFAPACRMQLLPGVLANTNTGEDKFADCVGDQARVVKIKEQTPPAHVAKVLSVAKTFYRPRKAIPIADISEQISKMKEAVRSDLNRVCDARMQRAQYLGCVATDASYLDLFDRDDLDRIDWSSANSRVISSQKELVNAYCRRICDERMKKPL